MGRLEAELRSTTVSPLIITSAWSQELPVRAEEPEMKVLLALTFLLAFLALGLSEPDTDRDVELLRDQLGVREKRESAGGNREGAKKEKKRKKRKNARKLKKNKKGVAKKYRNKRKRKQEKKKRIKRKTIKRE